MINRENLIKIGRAGGNTSNRETPDQIGRVGMSAASKLRDNESIEIKSLNRWSQSALPFCGKKAYTVLANSHALGVSLTPAG